MDYATPSLFFGMAIGAAVMWGLDRWYYTRNGRAELKAKKAELEALAKAQGIILRE